MIVAFTLYDWKWLSNYQVMMVNITDPQQQAGLANASIDIDFSALEKSDSKGDSLFVAGGRVYFETEVFQASTTTLTGKGFFDKLGYTEPPAPGKGHTGLILGITIPIAAVLIGVGVYCYCKRQEKQKKALRHLD